MRLSALTQWSIELGYNIDELDLDRIKTTYIWHGRWLDGNVAGIELLV